MSKLKVKKGDVLGWPNDDCGCRWLALSSKRVKKTATCGSSSDPVETVRPIEYLSHGWTPRVIAKEPRP